jgi:hypothetical protein
MGYRDLLDEDRDLISYRRKLNQLTEDVLATILLQQISYWYKKNEDRPFYKFRAPCGHKLYKDGDSWAEELGVSARQFDRAVSKIATKVTKGQSKAGLLASENNTCLVIYWTDSSRTTWWQLNVPLLEKRLEELYGQLPNGN